MKNYDVRFVTRKNSELIAAEAYERGTEKLVSATDASFANKEDALENLRMQLSDLDDDE